MLKSATMLKYMHGLDKALAEWRSQYPDLEAVFPQNCDVQFARVEENALRILASAIYVGHVASCWVPGEALNTKQATPDLVICRELLGPQGMKCTLLFPDGGSDVFSLDTDDNRYTYYKYLTELLSPE